MNRLIIIFLLLLLVSCANIQPPSGGPEDKEPPKITEFMPPNNSINYTGPIRITFDKYMDRSKVLENINIIPEIKFGIDWRAQELELNFSEDLKENTTYSVNLGTEYSDIYGNKPSMSHSIVFSSGVNIDSGEIKGHLISQKKQGKYIFCYSSLFHNFDTLNYSQTKPDYKIQIGSSGEFVIPGLKDGVYRIIAVEDVLRNGLIDKNDPYGTASEDIGVLKSKSKAVEIKDGILIDKQAPEISNITSAYSDRINIRFTEKMNDSSVYASQFILLDTLNNILAKSLGSTKGIYQQNSFDFLIDKKINDKILLSLKFVGNYLPSDSAGNQIDTTKSFKFMMIPSMDSSSLTLLYKPFPDSSNSISINKEFPFTFSGFIDKSKANFEFKLINKKTKEEIAIDTLNSADNIILFKSKNLLTENTDYLLNVKFSNIINVSSGKSMDTSIVINFTSEDKRNTGAISGKFLRNKLKCDSDTYLILKSKKNIHKVKLEKDGSFAIKALEGDEYEVEIFCDLNGNTFYDYGNISPFEFAEPFYLHNQTLKVKPRWTIDNLIITETTNVSK